MKAGATATAGDHVWSRRFSIDFFLVVFPSKMALVGAPSQQLLRVIVVRLFFTTSYFLYRRENAFSLLPLLKRSV